MCIAFELGNIKLVTLFAVSKECLRGGIGVLECVTLGSTGKKCGTQANYMDIGSVRSKFSCVLLRSLSDVM